VKKLHLIAYLLIVSGRVQGVGYRASVYRLASRDGITGHVRNMEDGRVEILAQSLDDENLERFVDSIRSVGSPARVIGVSKNQIAYSDSITSFRIIR
jgi:acylphosphatase